MQTTNYQRLRALTLAVAFAAISPLAALAQTANEFTGADALDTNAISAAAIHTVTFTPSTALVDGGSIVVSIPDNFGAFASLTAADVSAANTGGTFGAETFDTTQKTITIPVTAAGTGDSAVTVTIGVTNTLTNPATEGQYALQITTYGSDGIADDTGYAIASIANTVAVDAVVAEALVLTIGDTTLNLLADPSVNNGQDLTQSTILTISSNAYAGFMIQGALADTGSVANQIKGATHAATINGTPDGNTDNYFRVASSASSLGGGTTVANTAFAGTTTLYTSAAAGAALTNSDTVTLNYDLNVDYTKPADTYQGTITYTAVPTF
jgi:hypothetical protein